MMVFSTVVSIFSGISVITTVIMLFVKPIREKIIRSKEREEEEKKQIDEIKEELKEIRESISEMAVDAQNSKLEQKERDNLRDAKTARTQILRFADEIYEHTRHSKEHFDEILEQMTIYNSYCDTHPTFKNEKTKNAQARIKAVYSKCLEEHSFLGDI